MHTIATVRETDRYRALKRCIEKESQGFECIRKLQRSDAIYKEFKRDGRFFEFRGAEQVVYWEAIYKKAF